MHVSIEMFNSLSAFCLSKYYFTLAASNSQSLRWVRPSLTNTSYYMTNHLLNRRTRSDRPVGITQILPGIKGNRMVYEGFGESNDERCSKFEAHDASEAVTSQRLASRTLIWVVWIKLDMYIYNCGEFSLLNHDDSIGRWQRQLGIYIRSVWSGLVSSKAP